MTVQGKSIEAVLSQSKKVGQFIVCERDADGNPFELSRSGGGVAWLGFDSRKSRLVEILEFEQDTEFNEPSEDLQAFLPKVLDVPETERFSLVTDFFDGESAATYFQRCQGIPVAQALYLTWQLAVAIEGVRSSPGLEHWLPKQLEDIRVGLAEGYLRIRLGHRISGSQSEKAEPHQLVTEFLTAAIGSTPTPTAVDEILAKLKSGRFDPQLIGEIALWTGMAPPAFAASDNAPHRILAPHISHAEVQKLLGAGFTIAPKGCHFPYQFEAESKKKSSSKWLIHAYPAAHIVPRESYPSTVLIASSLSCESVMRPFSFWESKGVFLVAEDVGGRPLSLIVAGATSHSNSEARLWLEPLHQSLTEVESLRLPVAGLTLDDILCFEDADGNKKVRLRLFPMLARMARTDAPNDKSTDEIFVRIAAQVLGLRIGNPPTWIESVPSLPDSLCEFFRRAAVSAPARAETLGWLRKQDSAPVLTPRMVPKIAPLTSSPAEPVADEQEKPPKIMTARVRIPGIRQDHDEEEAQDEIDRAALEDFQRRRSVRKRWQIAALFAALLGFAGAWFYSKDQPNHIANEGSKDPALVTSSSTTSSISNDPLENPATTVSIPPAEVPKAQPIAREVQPEERETEPKDTKVTRAAPIQKEPKEIAKTEPKETAQKTEPKETAQKTEPKEIAQKTEPKEIVEPKPKEIAQKTEPKEIAKPEPKEIVKLKPKEIAKPTPKVTVKPEPKVTKTEPKETPKTEPKIEIAKAQPVKKPESEKPPVEPELPTQTLEKEPIETILATIRDRERESKKPDKVFAMYLDASEEYPKSTEARESIDRLLAKFGHDLPPHLLERAADHGHLDAARHLFERTQSLKWKTKAAELGHAPYMAGLGFQYSNGIGVNKDEKEAAKWLAKAAKKDHPDGLFLFGEALLLGKGIAPDPSHAVQLLSKAVEDHEETRAMHLLGVCYLEGKGVEKDQEKAAALFKSGARKGNAECMVRYAESLEKGIGVEEDFYRARAWYQTAATSRHPKAMAWCKEKGVAIPSLR